MKINIPEPNKEQRAKYDGSSFPSFFSYWVVLFYGKVQHDLAKEAGYFHDDLTVRRPKERLKNRLFYYLKLNRMGVKDSLIRQISIGLYIYDKCPDLIQKLLKKLTP